MRGSKRRVALVVMTWLVGGTVAWQCSGASQSSYDKCKAAGGDTKSGTCVKPGFRCDGEEGGGGAYGDPPVWYTCKGDPPVWVKDTPQPR